MNPTFFVAGGQLADAAGNASAAVPFIELDSTAEVTTDFSGKVSTHAVGSGARMADHFSLENPKFSIRGVTSNTPVYDTVYNNVSKNYGKRTKNVYDVLKSMFKSGQVFTLVCDLDSYQNCVISNFGFTQNVEQANALHLDLKIEQIRIATSRTVQAIIPNLNPEIAQDSTSKGQGGKVTGVEGDDEEFKSSFIAVGTGEG